MPLSEVAQALVRRGVITRASALEAERRKKLYGGGLDTALLELRAIDEATLTGHLAEISGIPLAPMSVLAEAPDPAARAWMDSATAQRLGVLPRVKQDDVLDVLVRPEHDHDAMVAWATKQALLIEPALVCEIRFRALFHALYGVPLPPRYLALLARLAGTTRLRAAVRDRANEDLRTPPPAPAPLDRIETLIEAARLGDLQARKLALRRLARHLQDPRVVAFRHALLRKAREAETVIGMAALSAVAEMRDRNAVPEVADLLEVANPQIAAAAHDALVTLACDDLGARPKRWLEWWAKMSSKPRVEWLLAGLAHRTPEIRLLAASDLYEISHEYFGYHHDLPERDREAARLRWVAWWEKRKSAGRNA
jgi:hypothetical protein